MKTKLTTLAWGATLGILFASVGGVRAASVPMAVSPGDVEGGSISGACPTLSWGPVEEAEAYELVIYRVGEEGVEGEPVVSQHIPGAALGWTPSLDRCLAPDEAYAWSVRATTADGLSEWAEPLFFEVPPGPSDEELAAVLEVLRRHHGVEGGLVSTQQGPNTTLALSEAPEVPDTNPSRFSAVPAESVGNSGAKLTVVGEVRTVDSEGEARLWGRGRAGTVVYGPPVIGYCENTAVGVRYGLSAALVDWGSAADACPAGTWVCRVSEVEACTTARPGSLAWYGCDGASFSASQGSQAGWVADTGPPGSGEVFHEHGGGSYWSTCKSAPVWCCWPGLIAAP